MHWKTSDVVASERKTNNESIYYMQVPGSLDFPDRLAEA